MADTPATVLFVCTGNICRSVMAGAMLHERAEAAGIVLGIRTAGLAGGGLPPPRRAVATMRKRGLDIEAHRSSHLAATMIDEASLVLGAARMHAWEAVALRPGAVRKIFTFKEFVRLGDLLGQPEAAKTLDDWIRQVHLSRRQFDLVYRDDEIQDPFRRSRRVYARVAHEIDTLVDRLSRRMFTVLAGQLEAVTWTATDIAVPPATSDPTAHTR